MAASICFFLSLIIIDHRTVTCGDRFPCSLTSYMTSRRAACPYRYCRRNWAMWRWTWSSCSLKNDAIWFDTVWNQGTGHGTRNCSRVTWNIWRWNNVTRSWFGRWRSRTTIIRQWASKGFTTSTIEVYGRLMILGKQRSWGRCRVWGIKANSQC